VTSLVKHHCNRLEVVSVHALEQPVTSKNVFRAKNINHNLIQFIGSVDIAKALSVYFNKTILSRRVVRSDCLNVNEIIAMTNDCGDKKEISTKSSSTYVVFATCNVHR